MGRQENTQERHTRNTKEAEKESVSTTVFGLIRVDIMMH
jgi:hypothetical protein